jgi:hypothetical protein
MGWLAVRVGYMDNKRAVDRRRILKPAKMTFNGGAVDCVVRNISETGAALEVESPVGIPENFVLSRGDEISRPCRVVWRKATRIGVRFQ